jgi:hypothetical protein
MKQTLIILVCLVFFSCKKEDVNNPPYFTFDNTAREWFSELKVHDTLKFLSNLGNVRIYEVNAIQEVKQLITGNCSFITSVCSIYYEYDELMISFNRIDSFSSPTDIKISMYIPDSLDYTNLPKNVVAKARILNRRWCSYFNYKAIIPPVETAVWSPTNGTKTETLQWLAVGQETRRRLARVVDVGLRMRRNTHRG